MMDSKSSAYSMILKHGTKACRQAAVEAYEDAQIRGLCAEGAFEAAMQAIDNLKLPLPEKRNDRCDVPDALPDDQS